MPVKIRLMRLGSKKRPFYRIVVANSTSKRGGRSIDQIGYYDPLTEPSTVKVDADRAVLWLQRGAQPTDTTARLLKEQGVIEKFEAAKKSGAAAPAAE